jgi:prepilin-type N-terminal cleavage/methylation domain-containing protein
MSSFFKKIKGGKSSGSQTSASAGFTLIELLVSVSIFVFMTAFLVMKYGTFNQTVLVTNTAYDIALTIRSVQSYGLNVKQSAYDGSFQRPFGAHFEKGSGTFNVFNDLSVPSNHIYNAPPEDSILSTSIIKKGIIVSDIQTICGGGATSTHSTVDISFKRPEPDAIIKVDSDPLPANKCQYVMIIVKAPDGSTKKVVVRSTGQIAIED